MSGFDRDSNVLRDRFGLLGFAFMATLPNPLTEARAVSRMIGVRARALADLADQIADSSKPAPEEWDTYSNGVGDLLKSLEADCSTFQMKASFR